MSVQNTVVPRSGNWRKGEERMAWLLAAPAILLLGSFLIVPFLMAVYFSFTNQRLVPNPNLETQFIGFRNYQRMLDDDTLKHALLNNFTFVIVVVPIQTVLALALALLVNQKLRAMNLFRTIYFTPVVTIMAVVAVIWYFLYNPGSGLINSFLQSITFGLFKPVDWLGDKSLALPSIMVLSIWQGVGFQMLIFLAGLQEIPDSLYEAADIDGASRWQQFRNVTIPGLRNTILFVVISTTILAFRLFDQIWVMTKGAPEDSTATMVLHIVQQGFSQQKVGYASAISVFFFLLVLTISILQRVFIKEERQV